MRKGENQQMMNEKERQEAVLEEKKGNFAALLPIIVFLALFIGSGVIAKDFYAMPTIVAFLIALGVAFVQNPKLSFNDKISVCTKGIGDDNVVTMCLIFLTAGARPCLIGPTSLPLYPVSHW